MRAIIFFFVVAFIIYFILSRESDEAFNALLTLFALAMAFGITCLVRYFYYDGKKINYPKSSPATEEPKQKIKIITLPIGKNLVEIIECGLELSEEEIIWNDRTPRLKIIVGNKRGKITTYMNLRGYKNASDFEGEIAPFGYEFRSLDRNLERVLVDKKTGKRIESPERTTELREKVGNVAYAAGIEMEEIDLDTFQEEIVGKTVGVIVA